MRGIQAPRRSKQCVQACGRGASMLEFAAILPILLILLIGIIDTSRFWFARTSVAFGLANAANLAVRYDNMNVDPLRLNPENGEDLSRVNGFVEDRYTVIDTALNFPMAAMIGPSGSGAAITYRSFTLQPPLHEDSFTLTADGRYNVDALVVRPGEEYAAVDDPSHRVSHPTYPYRSTVDRMSSLLKDHPLMLYAEFNFGWLLPFFEPITVKVTAFGWIERVWDGSVPEYFNDPPTLPPPPTKTPTSTATNTPLPTNTPAFTNTPTATPGCDIFGSTLCDLSPLFGGPGTISCEQCVYRGCGPCLGQCLSLCQAQIESEMSNKIGFENAPSYIICAEQMECPVVAPTSTPTPTLTATNTGTPPTATPTRTATNTPTVTNTRTPRPTYTITATPSNTATTTNTATISPTPTPTNTATATLEATATNTPYSTATPIIDPNSETEGNTE